MTGEAAKRRQGRIGLFGTLVFFYIALFMACDCNKNKGNMNENALK